MKRNFTSRFLPIAFLLLPYLSNAGSPYCTSFPGTGCTAGDYISNFKLTGACGTTLSDLGSVCPSPTNAYDDRTTEGATLLQGQTYSGTISAGRLGDYAAIWIDFNNDGTFDPSELVGTAGNYTANPISTSASGTAFTITIPSSPTVLPGIYRMRIHLAFEVNPTTIDPCTSYTSGDEVRDYTVDIAPPAPTATSNSPVCTGRPLTLFATDAATGTYSWTGPSFSSPDQNPVIASASAGNAGTYSVTITSNGVTSCPATIDTTIVAVNTSPGAIIDPAGTVTLCADSLLLAANAGGGLTYTWLDNGTSTGITTATNTVHASGNYQVIVSNAFCTDTSATTALTLNQIPPATITPQSATTFCVGQSVVLQANTGGGLSYQWLDGGATTGITTANDTVNASGNYEVIVSDGTCADTSSAASVTVMPIPVATIVPGATLICQGQVRTLQATTGAGLFYQWQHAGVNINGATDATFDVTVTGNYRVIVSNGTCADTSAVTTITVHPKPAATITPQGPTTFCQGQDVILHANAGGGLSYQWTVDSTSTGITTITDTVNVSGNYQVITSNGTCFDTSVATTVTVSPIPVAIVSPQGPATFCQGLSVTLQATTGAGLSYQWQNGSGNISGATDATYTATTTNGYDVIVSNGICADTSQAFPVTANPVPAANITTTTPTAFCDGGNVTFHTNSAPNLTYQWRVDSVNIAGTNDSLFTTATSGYYDVIVTNTSDCSDTSGPVQVTVLAIPDAIVAPGDTAICQGESITLQGTTGAGLFYQWQNGSGNISGATNATYTTGTGDSYDVIVSNGICADTSAGSTITVNPVPAATVTPLGPTSFCQGGSVDLSANTGAGYTYQWTDNDTVVTGATTADFTASISGSYAVVVTNGSNCSDTSAATTVTVNQFPDTTLAILGQTVFCAGGDISLSVSVCPDCTYQWYNNDNAIADATASLTTDSSGSYFVVINSAANCMDTSATLPVTVNPLPTATISHTTPLTFCAGDSVVLHSHTNIGVSYQWYLNHVPINGATDITYTATTTGSYKVFISSGLGCTDSSTAVNVNAIPLPVATITPAGPISVCQGNDVTLHAHPNAGVTYQWFANDTAITGATDETYTVVASGNYTMVATNATSCSDTAAADTVTINPLPANTITYTGDTTFCQGDSLLLQASTDVGTIFQWMADGTPIHAALDSTYTTGSAGFYQVIVESAAGCTDTSAGVNIAVNPLADTTLSVSSVSGMATFCAGSDSVTLQVHQCDSCTYQWYNNGNALINDTTASYTADSTGTYYLVITNGSGCSDTTTPTTVTANALPENTITFNTPTTFCQGDSVVLFAKTDNGITYQWLNSGNVIDDATNSDYTATDPGDYQVIISNAAGCSDTTSPVVTVTVNPLPTVIISPSGNLGFCQGTTLVLHALPPIGIFQWYINDTAVTGATDATFPATTAGNYTVMLSNGTCSDTSAITVITIDTLPVAVITAGSDTSFCVGGNVVLSADTGAGFTYHWQKDGVNVVPAATSVTYTASVTGGYRVVITNGTGCSDTSNVIQVTANPFPTNAITHILGSTFCLGDSTVLKASAGANYEYQWLLNGNPVLDSTADSITVHNSGSYKVIITNSATGCADTTTTQVNVTANLPPTATITGGPTTFCQNSSVLLTASTTTPPGSTITHYLWNKNDTAIIPPATNSTYTASVAGSYTVTVTNSNGCIDTSASDTVVVHPLPNAVISPAGLVAVCPGGVVVMNANIDSVTTYQWNDNATPIPGATTSSYVASITGSYTVTNTNIYNCMQTSPATVVDIDTPKITPSGPTTICQGQIAVLNANTGPNFTYQWYLNDTAIVGANGSSYNASTSGSYTVVVTIGTTCSATSDPVMITVNPTPTVNVTSTGPSSFCMGGSDTLIASADTVVTYQWYRNTFNNPIPGATDSSYTATVSGVYYTIAVNSYNCAATSTPVNIMVHPLPVPVITPEGSTTVCVHGSLALDATLGAGFTYQWYLDSVAIPGATDTSYTVNTSGNYTVTITSGAGCSATSAPTLVTIYAAPQLVSENPTTFCFGSSDVLYVKTNVLNASGFSYQWQDNGTNIAGATDTAISAYMPGSYTCVVTATNGCISAEDTPIVLTVDSLPAPIIALNGYTLSTSGSFITYQWYENHAAIDGATSPSVTITENGNYYVAVSDGNGCVSVSDVYVLQNLGVNNVQAIGDAIKIYPNPANATVHIASPVSVNVTVSSLDGKVVLRKDEATDIDVSNLANGVYMITMYDRNGALLKIDKLVKTAY